MTSNKLRKYLAKVQPSVHGVQRRTPLLLADSKGSRLEREISPTNIIHQSIQFRCKSGAKTHECTNWLRHHIEQEIQTHGDIHIYIWAATCDLTTKKQDHSIELTSESNDIVNNIITQYREIASIVNHYTSSRVTFLSIPAYSIVKYNKYNRLPILDKYYDQDSILLFQIHLLNEQIGELNKLQKQTSPDFSKDLCRNPRHTTCRGQERYTKLDYNFELYQDGIHPRFILNKVWLHKFALQIQHDCWFPLD
ncbi:unnamed protein product [Mytilus edulis]|uniref:Uncharacterized protein n=1 Tax=Mytilus edulis TaxID=6550 RepID=A0A8S3UX76_MYTED|nr:unnamed protein product [Mytilus edulis]